MTEQLQLRRGTAAQVAGFIGAQGEVVVDTTNNRAVVNDGTTAGGWPAAKLAEVVTNTRVGVADANYTALNSDRLIAYATLTAARVVTLSAASAYPTGARLMIVDESGACSTTKTITIVGAGSDTIDGAASFVIEAAYGGLEIESNGAGAWTILSPRPNLQTSLIGVGTAPDPSNVLSAYGASALFSGTNFNLTINKAAAADTASLIFEDAFSGRAQLGLNGSDNFSFKVSANGSAWTTAIALDAATGAPTFANQRTAVADTAYGGLATDRLIAYTALTAARVVNLPAAAAYPVGTRLLVVDETGNCSAANTITLSGAGSDTINGGASAVISTAYGFVALESNGANAWTIVDAAIVTSSGARTAIADANYSALATDRFVAYTTLTAARVVSLPTAAAYPVGTRLLIVDETGNCSPTNTISLSRAGADTIDGATSAVISTAYGFLALESNGAGKWTVVDAAIVTPASATAGNVAVFGATPNTLADGGASFRKLLSSAATYYVRAAVGNVAISDASPAVASLTAHGLQANDPVVFSILPFQAAVTITQANPAVVTWTAHGFSAGQPVVFASTGDLPYGIVAGTTYYVIAAGLTTNAFEISATVGGSAISTAAPTLTFTNSSANIGLTTASTYLKVGQQVQFANSGGALPTNFAAATTYYVLSVNSTTITVSATNGGSAISAGSAGSGTQSLSQGGTHYGSATGSLPTGVTAGTVYYVLSTGLTANAFEFSATVGGAAINTSGAQAGTISLATGNDANTGLAQNRAGAFLSINAALTAAAALDCSTYALTVQLADGVYPNANLPAMIGSKTFSLLGDTAYPSNVLVQGGGGAAINASAGPGVIWTINGLTLASTGWHDINAVNCSLTLGNAMNFGAAPSGAHMDVSLGASITAASYMISGAASTHFGAGPGGVFNLSGGTIALLGVPAFSSYFAGLSSLGNASLWSTTLAGSATGTRYSISTNSVFNTYGQSSTYLPGNAAGSTASGGQYV